MGIIGTHWRKQPPRRHTEQSDGHQRGGQSDPGTHLGMQGEKSEFRNLTEEKNNDRPMSWKACGSRTSDGTYPNVLR
jgi:hypothetical protein